MFDGLCIRIQSFKFMSSLSSLINYYYENLRSMSDVTSYSLQIFGSVPGYIVSK